MVVLEAITIGAVAYAINKNRKNKKKMNMITTTTTTTTTTHQPGATYIIQGAPGYPVMGPAPATSYLQEDRTLLAPTSTSSISTPVQTKTTPMSKQTVGTSTTPVTFSQESFSSAYQPVTNYEEVNLLGSTKIDTSLSIISIRNEFGSVVLNGSSGLLSSDSKSGLQTLSVNVFGSQLLNDLPEGKKYFVDATSNRGQKFNNMAFYYYGVSNNVHVFSVVSQ
ncbi:hypothetical protein AKO1_014002 [Acrasis kona]|uniref:Uncharacterized protein n=1 Tax=Acrasis kona TaxID=1008807 RepID=A0AAW2Z1Q0_9EUKA